MNHQGSRGIYLWKYTALEVGNKSPISDTEGTEKTLTNCQEYIPLQGSDD